MVALTPVLMGLIGAIASVFASALSTWYAAYRRKGETAPTLESRASSLNRSLRDAIGLIDEIQSEVESRQRLSERLAADVETNKRLANLHQAEVDAVVQSIRGELRKEGRRAFWQSSGVNFVLFGLGAGLSALFFVFGR